MVIVDKAPLLRKEGMILCSRRPLKKPSMTTKREKVAHSISQESEFIFIFFFITTMLIALHWLHPCSNASFLIRERGVHELYNKPCLVAVFRALAVLFLDTKKETVGSAGASSLRSPTTLWDEHQAASLISRVKHGTNFSSLELKAAEMPVDLFDWRTQHASEMSSF